MANGYMPRRDQDASAWMRVFADGLLADPARYGVSASDANQVDAAVGAFAEALARSADPDQRTAVAVAAKDQARARAEGMCKTFYMIIKHNLGITGADKIAIGVRPPNPFRSKVSCPQSSPMLKVIAATPGQHVLAYNDSATPQSGRKPFGAAFLEVRVALGETPATSVAAASPAGAVTRTPFEIAYTHADDRKRATYFARWVSRRGETGPWSLPVSFTVAA